MLPDLIVQWNIVACAGEPLSVGAIPNMVGITTYLSLLGRSIPRFTMMTIGQENPAGNFPAP